VRGVFPAKRTVLLKLQAVRVVPFVFGSGVVSSLTLTTSQGHCHPHNLYSRTLVTLPAPTVRPPSRIAKRTPSSRAMGAISSTSISVLSPGITISTPSGSLMVPVTSVVLT